MLFKTMGYMVGGISESPPLMPPRLIPAREASPLRLPPTDPLLSPFWDKGSRGGIDIGTTQGKNNAH